MNGTIPKAAFAIFPSTEGFGWIVFDGPLSPVDWDACSLGRKPGDQKNAQCLRKIDALLRFYRPETVVLEKFEGKATRRGARIKELCLSIVSAATMSGSKVRIISREKIEASFPDTPAKTRYAVSKIVESYLPDIRHRMPKKRRLWEKEPPRMALFNAAALLVVHYANPAEPADVPHET